MIQRTLIGVAADATITGHTAAVSKAAIKPLLDIDYWPVDNDGLDRGRLERFTGLMKKIGGHYARPSAR